MKNILNRILIFLIVASPCIKVTAQLNPSPSQYFFNQIVQSAAATGLKDATRLDMSFRNVVPNSFFGSPVNQYVTVQSQLSNGAGVGLQFNSDNAGLLTRNRVLGSYALDLSKGSTRVRLGAGLGILMSRINNKNGTLLRGDLNDPAIAEFNQQKMDIDGTLGLMIETEKGLQLLVSLPSIGSIQQFSKFSAVNYTVLNTMVKKRFNLGQGGNEYVKGMSSIEPILGYRLIKGQGGVIDAGVFLNFQEWIGFTAMYHTNSEYAFGINIPHKDRFMFNFTYNTGKVYTKNYMSVGGTLEGHLMIKLAGSK